MKGSTSYSITEIIMKTTHKHCNFCLVSVKGVSDDYEEQKRKALFLRKTRLV